MPLLQQLNNKITRILCFSLAFSGLTVTFASADRSAAIAQVNSQAIVEAHNQLRQNVGTPDLSWSDDLAKVAEDWAKYLVSQGGNLAHRPNTRYGENIYWISGRNASEADVVNAWGNERRDFVYGVFPNVSKTGKWSDVGHYTQIVWSSTTEVGCGMASTARYEIWVCNYNPAGNVLGRTPYSPAR